MTVGIHHSSRSVRTRQTRPSPFGCYGSGYSTFALNQDPPSAASYIVTVPPP